MLRDLIIRLGVADLAELRWSDTVQEEWLRNVLMKQPGLSKAALQRTQTLTDRALPGACVTGFEPLIPTVVLPDPDDRHVVAAAIQGGATHILTFNLRDFPANALARHGLTALHPDVWLMELIDTWPDETLAVVTSLAGALRTPAMTPVQVISALRNLNVPVSADRLEHVLSAAG